MSTTLDALNNDRDQVRFQLMNGTIIPVDLSILYQYPNSHLTKCALDAWNEDPEQIVYPLMDDVMFPLVLSFIQSKKIELAHDSCVNADLFLEYLEKLGPWPESLETSQVCLDMFKTKEQRARKYQATEMYKFLSLEVTAYDVAREVLRRYLIELNPTVSFTNKVHDYDTYMSLKRIKDGDVVLGKACDELLTRFGVKIQSLEIKAVYPSSSMIVHLCEASEHEEGVSNIVQTTEKSSILVFIKEDAPAVKLAASSLRAFLKSETNSCFYFDESQAHRVYAPRLLQKANQVLKRFGSIEIQSIERDGRIQVRLDEDYVSS